MKTTLIVLLILQSFAYAGPVCGNHGTTAESMACCEKGHNDGSEDSIADSHSSSCCATCDMGKATAIKKQDQQLLSPAWVLSAILPDNQELLTAAESVDSSWKNQKFTSYSPPQVFLLNATFLI